MKLTKTTELALVGGLILYIVFTPGFPVALRILGTPIGSIAALLGIVYVWKNVSALVALLLTILFVKCTRMAMREGFSGAEDTCVCEEEGFTWDPATKKCTNADGLDGKIKSCTCIAGYSWDGGEKGTQQCVPTSGEQPPLPTPATNPVVTAMEATAPTVAPAVSTGPVTSTAPMTTPGAAQAAAASMGPSPAAAPSGGVQPSEGSAASTPATM
jgi:hypothetical protein